MQLDTRQPPGESQGALLLGKVLNRKPLFPQNDAVSWNSLIITRKECIPIPFKGSHPFGGVYHLSLSPYLSLPHTQTYIDTHTDQMWGGGGFPEAHR